jgi:hypothetical protein
MLPGRIEVSTERRLLRHGQAATILLQSGVVGMGFLKEKWTEAEVLNLPAGEHNYFDRKSGGLLTDTTNFQAKFAKAESALANSGGGHIIFGQEDDGSITGVPHLVKKTPMREWLEQKLPFLVSYPLESFRVHQVIRDAAGSIIPTDKELIVIDVGDSRLAPHQASFPPDNPQYYYRQGGKSIAAPHHYLEALRNRLTYAVLEATLDRVHLGESWRDGEDFVIIAIILRFRIKNLSRIACYKWGLEVRFEADGGEDFIRTKEQFSPLGRVRGILVDKTILPTRQAEEFFSLGFRVNLKQSLARQVQENWPKITVVYYPISENHISAERETKIDSMPLHRPLSEQIEGSLNLMAARFIP